MNDIVNKVLNKNSTTFKNLAIIEQLEKSGSTEKEAQIALWLLHNKDSIKSLIDKCHNVGAHLFPDNLYEIYLDNFSNKAVEIVKKQIQDHTQLDPEEMANINSKFIISILGDKFLSPPNKG